MRVNSEEFGCQGQIITCSDQHVNRPKLAGVKTKLSIFIFTDVWFQKISIPPPWRELEIPEEWGRGRGVMGGGPVNG